LRSGIWLSIVVAILLILPLVILLRQPTGVNRKGPANITDNLRDMRRELEGVKTVLWIGPHADDEVYVAGLLYYAGMEGKDCIIAAYRRSDSRVKLNLMSAELLRCRYVYLTEYPGRSAEERIRSLIELESPDLILTFHPETGFRMSEAHARIGKLVTEVVSRGNRGAKLFYILNKDPALEKLLGGADLARQTHFLDLHLIVGGRSLFEAKISDICIYSDAVPAAKAICENAWGVRDEMMRYELYAEYSPN